MMALYALMHERSNHFGKLKIQDCLEPAIKPYFTVITNVAMNYAKAYEQDLDSLADNLINLIHDKKPARVSDLLAVHLFDEIKEDMLLDIIKSDNDNQNCLMM